ncbi:MAG: hypothetical protein U0169_26965 [Polyangiaceae bacterium]
MPSTTRLVRQLVVFGAGYVGARAAAEGRRRGLRVVATVRSEVRERALREAGFDVCRSAVVDVARDRVDEHTHAVVAFPPDGVTDANLAPLLAGARAVTYVSSLSVYGEYRGIVDDTTPVTGVPGDAQARWLAAEDAYRSVGGTVLRAPGIYGPDRGLVTRILRGEHQLPGDGSNVTSRIHADDLANLLLACRDVRGETFVVGDLDPVPQREVARWVQDTFGAPFPPEVPAEHVHESLRRDRAVDPRRALTRLGVTLRYPSFRTATYVVTV